MEEEDLYKMLYKESEEESNQDHIKIPCENYGKDFKFLQNMGYDGKGPLGLQKKGIVESLQPNLVPKNQRTKGLGFTPLRLCCLGSQTISKIMDPTSTNNQQQEKRYYTDSNEWEWGSDRSYSDYELTKTFRELGEATKEEKFEKIFRVGKTTSSSFTSKEKKDSG